MARDAINQLILLARSLEIHERAGRTIDRDAQRKTHVRETMPDDAASDEQTLQELAQRLLHHPHPDGPTSVELFVRRLPDAWPSELPLPAAATLIGSALYLRRGTPFWIEAVLDARDESSAFLAAYEDEVACRGWTATEDSGPMHGGFVSNEMGEGRVFRVRDQGPILVVSVRTRAADESDVRLRLDWQLARHLSAGPRPLPPGADRMPRLRPPAHVVIKGESGSGGNGRWTSDTTAHTDRPVAELEAHFAEQLAQAGWMRVAGTADEVVGWSAWQLPGDGAWRGLLLVLAAHGGTERFLTLRIETNDPSDDGAGS
jgi:hypothetical protein